MASTTTSVRMVMPDSNVKPLTLDDKQVLGLVYDCYVVNKPGETFDPEALFSVVSDILVRSFRTSDPSTKHDPLEKLDKTYLANLEPPIDLLKRFACQMRGTQRHEYHTNAHETTMSILKTLDSYSWCAKAVTALAAFALDYGIFWHLYEQWLQRQDSSLGNSLAVLSNVHAISKNRDIYDYNVVVKNVLITVGHMVRLESIMKTYDGKNIPTLEKAMHEFPALVYWTVLTVVILASHMDILSGHPLGRYKLSDIGSKISTIDMRLKDYLIQIDREKAYIDDYRYRDRIAFQTPTDRINDDDYIIIYGRTETDWYDDQWLNKMPEALERIKKDHENIRRFDICINYSHHGKGHKERYTVARFWSYVESTFDSMRRMKAEDIDEDTFRQVKSFLGLRQEHSGWVLLSKGPNVKLLGRGDCFYQTLDDFDLWKHNIEQDSGFDVSLRNYYESVKSELPHHAAHCRQMVLKNYLSNIYDPVHCPDCGLKMKLQSAEYTCCHGDKDEVINDADASGGNVEIMR